MWQHSHFGLRQKRHKEAGEKIVSPKRSEAHALPGQLPLGSPSFEAYPPPHLLQQTYSASFLKPMARRFVGVPLVPFQTWVFQGSGWEERTMVTVGRESGSS